LPAIWGFVTDFGDSAVTVPLALLTLVFLVAAGQRRLALGWALTIGGCAVSIGALKLLFGACGPLLTSGQIVSPSGHTAMSAAVYGSLALLVGARLSPHWCRAIVFATWVAIIGIAMSRVVLHDHTQAEIAVGLVVGAGSVMIFRALLGQLRPPALPLRWLLLVGAGLIAVMHGTRWIIEPTLHRLAWDFRFVLQWCR